jgi:hypothetical protein
MGILSQTFAFNDSFASANEIDSVICRLFLGHATPEAGIRFCRDDLSGTLAFIDNFFGRPHVPVEMLAPNGAPASDTDYCFH